EAAPRRCLSGAYGLQTRPHAVQALLHRTSSRPRRPRAYATPVTSTATNNMATPRHSPGRDVRCPWLHHVDQAVIQPDESHVIEHLAHAAIPFLARIRCMSASKSSRLLLESKPIAAAG